MTEIAIIGNPNSGKTTLYNALTGEYQKTGNWTGVTTEARIGGYKKNKNVKIVDLPGIYSLSANSLDEKAVIDYLKQDKVSAIINIVDGTNLERNLYLTCELAHMNIPTIIAINMCDQLLKNNQKIEIKEFEKIFGVPIILISATKQINIDKVIDLALNNKRKLVKLANINNAEQSYSFIEKIIPKIITPSNAKSTRTTEKLDKIFLHKYLCFPIFFTILTIIYFLSIKIGGGIGEYILKAFKSWEIFTKNQLHERAIHFIVSDFVCRAIISGAGAIFSLLPQVLILNLLLSVLEQSGYSSRIAFMFDRFFSLLDLSGKSIIPMLLCCGCTVPGLTATRTIESKKQREATIFLAPFMPCGAKMAVFGFFAYSLFDGKAYIATSMYIISIICIVIFGLILKKLKLLGKQTCTFVLEMPTYKFPNIFEIFIVIKEKCKEFLLKVGSIVFILSIIIWILENFGINGYVNGDIEKSFLFFIGNSIKFIFYPLGFSSWQSSISIICGMFAKEGIVETLHMLSSNPRSLFKTGYSAYAFMSFILLSPPCMASLITAKRELKNNKRFLFMIVFQFVCAYIVATIINLFGILIACNINLLLFTIVAIIIITTLFFIIKTKYRRI